MKWTLRPAAEFGNHSGAWQALNDAASRSPLLAVDFVAPLLKEFGEGGEVLALCDGADGLQAAALVAPRGRGTWETFQPSQGPIGAWIQKPGLSTPELMNGLLRALPGLALRIGVTQQDPDLVPRPADGGAIETLDYIPTARISIEGGFAQYWEQRGKYLRQNMRKQRNRLEKEGVKTSLEMTTSATGVAQAIADYGQLESAGWKAAGGTAVHPDNAQGRFYQAVLENFCRKGSGRIYRYRFNDRVVVVDLCIEGAGSLIILKTTYDESIKTLSPAFLMREETFRTLFEERRFKRIEFYGKVMDWHTKWTNEIRTMYHVTGYRWPFLRGIRRALTKTTSAAPAPEKDQATDTPG